MALLCLILSNLKSQTQTCLEAQAINSQPVTLFGADPAWYYFDVPYNGEILLASCSYNAHPQLEVYLGCENAIPIDPISQTSTANCGAETCNTPQLLIYEVPANTRVILL